MNNKKLEGIFTALLTPFDENGNILFDSLQRHVDFLISQGVDGFYVNGSTGESFLITPEERKKVLEAVIEANNGRAAIINHCGNIGTDLSIDLIKHCANLPIDGVSSVPPFYYGFSKDELVAYYNDLANASDKPFIVYNMPKFSGVIITPAIMKELRKNKNIVGLKFTHNDFYALQQIRASDPDLIIYNGFDEMAICGFSLGCNGAIGSTYNVIAPLIIKLRNLCSENDYVSARKVQTIINEYINGMVLNGKHFAITKYMISKLEGINYGIVRRPFSQISDVEKKVADNMIASLTAN